jgi:hypothetical protein
MISANRFSRPFCLSMVEMKMELALERQRKVVFPAFLSRDTPRTMAGCCIFSERARYVLLWRDTNVRHYTECVFDLFSGDSTSMDLAKGLGTIKMDTGRVLFEFKSVGNYIH